MINSDKCTFREKNRNSSAFSEKNRQRTASLSAFNRRMHNMLDNIKHVVDFVSSVTKVLQCLLESSVLQLHTVPT